MQNKKVECSCYSNNAYLLLFPPIAWFVAIFAIFAFLFPPIASPTSPFAPSAPPPRLTSSRSSVCTTAFKEESEVGKMDINADAEVKEQSDVRVETETRSGPSKTTSSKTNTTNNPTTSKASVKLAATTSNPANSVCAMTKEAREGVKEALQKLFKNVKVCRFQEIGPLLRDMAVLEHTGLAKHAVAAANMMDAYPDDFKAIVEKVAVDVHGNYVPKSSPEDPKFDPFRKVVIDLFLAGGPNAKLKKAAIREAAKMKLGKDVDEYEYKKVMSELCSLTGDHRWILNSDDRMLETQNSNKNA